MAELLPEQRFQRNNELTLQLKGNTTTFKKQQHKHDLTFPQWSDAFDIFMAVYVERSKSAAKTTALVQQMLTYRKHISNLKRMGYDWQNYDRHFRKDREPRRRSKHGHTKHRGTKRCSFGTPRHDLMMTYQPQSKDLFRPSNQINVRGSSKRYQSGSEGHQQIPYGYCILFHSREVTCPKGYQCPYSHKCPRCNRNHPLYWNCNSSNHTKSQRNSTTTTNNGHSKGNNNNLPSYANQNKPPTNTHRPS